MLMGCKETRRAIRRRGVTRQAFPGSGVAADTGEVFWRGLPLNGFRKILVSDVEILPLEVIL